MPVIRTKLVCLSTQFTVAVSADLHARDTRPVACNQEGISPQAETVVGNHSAPTRDTIQRGLVS